MTIQYVCKRFVKGSPIKGAYMGVEEVDGKEVLQHRWSGTNKGPIAEILNRKENGDFDLLIYPNVRYGKTSHNNRVYGVLQALAGEDYRDIRYTSFVRYDVIVYDRKLEVEYHLKENPLKIKYRGGKLVVDYAELESHAVPQEEKPVVAAQPKDNDNIKNIVANLSTILTTV